MSSTVTPIASTRLRETRRIRPHEAPHWYAFYTRGRHEKQVHAGFRRGGIESYLPLLPRERQWHDRRTIVEMPLFPSYVFARLPLHGLHRACRIPGVVHVVSLAGRPTPVPERDVENVRMLVAAIVATGIDPEIDGFDPLEPGVPVRITEGAFAGIEGTIVQLRGRRLLLRVGFRAVGQAVRVEVEAAHLERLDEGAPRDRRLRRDATV